MKWSEVLDIGLGVANVAMNASNASKLEQLQMQGAVAALVQAVIKELRNQIFNYKQTAESILSTESESVSRTACAMKILELRLIDSGITPDLFEELNDKEYALKTIRFIEDNSDRLLNQLTEDKKMEVINVASTTNQIQDYDFYVQNYRTGRKLQKASAIVDTYKDRQGCLVLIGIGLYIYPGIALPALLSIGLGGKSEIGQIIVGAIGFALWGFGLVKILEWKNGRKYKEAKKFVEQNPNFNLDHFNTLDKKFGNIEEVKILLEKAQQIAYNFFGDPKFLPQQISDEEKAIEQEKEAKRKEVDTRKRIEGYGLQVVVCPKCQTINSLSVANCIECEMGLLNAKPVPNPYLAS